MRKNLPLPVEMLGIPGRSFEGAMPVRRVPKPSERLPLLSHPRLRRSSPISHFAAAAAVEAMGSTPQAAGDRTGVIFTLLNGCVNYSGRFYGEVLRDPSTASPILFPETVFNAPASHLATVLGLSGPAFTLIGDSAQFIPGLEMAVQWLLDDAVDACLVIGAEEVDPLTAGALRLLAPGAILSEGAGALLLVRDGAGPSIHSIAGPVSFRALTSRAVRLAAALELRKVMEPIPPGALLVDDANGCSRCDAAGREAWGNWSGPVQSPRLLLGEAPGASTALQCLAADSAVRRGGYQAAIVSAIGADQQASGLILEAGGAEDS